MLAKINWTFFFKEELFEQNMPALLAAMGKVIDQKTEEDTPKPLDDSKLTSHHTKPLDKNKLTCHRTKPLNESNTKI